MTKKLNKHHHSWKIRQYFIFIFQESRSWKALRGYRRCILIISQAQPTWVRVPIPFSIFNIRHLPKIVCFTTQLLITLWVRGYGVVIPLSTIFQLYRGGEFYWVSKYLCYVLRNFKNVRKHNIFEGLGLGLWCCTRFQQYFSYIVTVSFIGEGNWSNWSKPPTCRRSLTYLSNNGVSSTPRHERDSNSQRITLWVYLFVWQLLKVTMNTLHII